MNAVIDRTKPQASGSSEEFEALESDVYVMEIVDAKLEEDTMFPNDDGSLNTKLVLTWEEAETGTRVWQRFNPYYGTVKGGAPSKFMAFVDNLATQGLIEDQFDMEKDLVGIKQRVNVEKYLKTMGANKGKPGNKVISIMPLRRAKPAAPKASAKPAPAATEEDPDEMPF